MPPPRDRGPRINRAIRKSPVRLIGSDGEQHGIVSVDETRVDGMTDFLVVHRGHTLIMNDRQVAAQAVHFFRHGRFRR